MTEDNIINGVSIVIPNWNGLHLLKQSLDPLLKATNAYVGESEIIIVDIDSYTDLFTNSICVRCFC